MAYDYEPGIAALIAEHGEVPPGWHAFPDIHPFSIGWRMGGGEDYIHMFHQWWTRTKTGWSEAERLAYFKRWPASPCWTLHIAQMVWDISYEDTKSENGKRQAIARLAPHGFASFEAYEADMNDEKWH